MPDDGSPQTGNPLTIVMLVYPGMTLLDMAGPQCVLGLHGRCHLVWRTLDPIVTDSGVTLVPDTTFDDCPREMDVLFVPGAMDNVALMEDEGTMSFLRRTAAGARYVTSVCSGSLLLGAAGLLDGRRSACHWAYVDVLRELGVQVVDDRVVRDGDHLSGGGVTAGIDFGLTLLAELPGEEAARVMQLAIQYDPEPPFDAGVPQKAGTSTTATALRLTGGIAERGVATARRLRERRPASA